MSKFKAKWTSILLALCCVFACLGVGVALWNSNNASAAQYVTKELGTLTLHANSVTGGAKDVGESTTKAAVLSTVYMLIADFIINIICVF